MCWPANGQGQDPAGPRAGSALLTGRLQDCGFLQSCVCSLVGDAGPEASAGSLKGRVRAQGILGLMPAHWWMGLGPAPSDGQD